MGVGSILCSTGTASALASLMAYSVLTKGLQEERIFCPYCNTMNEASASKHRAVVLHLMGLDHDIVDIVDGSGSGVCMQACNLIVAGPVPLEQ